jgi:serine/threonine protein kinase
MRLLRRSIPECGHTPLPIGRAIVVRRNQQNEITRVLTNRTVCLGCQPVCHCLGRNPCTSDVVICVNKTVVSPGQLRSLSDQSPSSTIACTLRRASFSAMSQPVNVIRTSQGPQVGPYIFGKTLGTGSTGKVKLAKNLETGEVVAIKIVRKDFLERKPSLKKKMRREISVLKMLSHPNVMSLIDVFEIETHLFLVMEFVDGLELFEYLVRRGALPPDEARAFFQQIICGLEYCHRRLICHRDLKPENLVSLLTKRASCSLPSRTIIG